MLSLVSCQVRIFNFLFHSFLFYSTTAHTSRTLFQYWVQYSENLNILIRMCLVALGNAEADRLAARGSAATHLAGIHACLHLIPGNLFHGVLSFVALLV